MSEGFKVLNTVDEIGAPSKIYNGAVPASIELTPRRRIEADFEGSPEPDNTERPAT